MTGESTLSDGTATPGASRRVPAARLAVLTAAVVGVWLLLLASSDSAEPPRPEGLRIVSLSPSATEILFALGVGDSVVGATTFCNYPPAASRIERVGGFGSPNVEKLLSLRPDLIVAAGFERADALKMLRDSGLRIVDVQAKNFEELFAAVLRTGVAAHRTKQAEELVAKMRADLKALAKHRDALPNRRATRVFVELWDSPLTTAGATSFLDDVIARAGGVNVAHDLRHPHPRVNAEKVIEWDPEVIVVARMARPRDAARIAGRVGWEGISAVQRGRIVDDIPCDLLLRPGPRLIDGVKALAARLEETRPEPPTAKGR